MSSLQNPNRLRPRPTYRSDCDPAVRLITTSKGSANQESEERPMPNEPRSSPRPAKGSVGPGRQHLVAYILLRPALHEAEERKIWAVHRRKTPRGRRDRLDDQSVIRDLRYLRRDKLVL